MILRVLVAAEEKKAERLYRKKLCSIKTAMNPEKQIE